MILHKESKMKQQRLNTCVDSFRMLYNVHGLGLVLSFLRIVKIYKSIMGKAHEVDGCVMHVRIANSLAQNEATGPNGMERCGHIYK